MRKKIALLIVIVVRYLVNTVFARIKLICNGHWRVFSRKVYFNQAKGAQFNAKKARIYKNSSIIIGKRGNFSMMRGAWVGPQVNINCVKFSLGKYSSIHPYGAINGDVKIGDYVMIAKNVFISSGKHHYKNNPHLPIKIQDLQYEKVYGDFSDKVIIEDDVWIGVNCVINHGVKIGKGSIIAANSFVNSNVPPYDIFGGSPAKVIGSRLDFSPPKDLDPSCEAHLPYFYSGFDFETSPFVLSKSMDFIYAADSFSVALSWDSEEYISLLIRSKEADRKICFNSQIFCVQTEFKVISFKIKGGVDGNIFTFIDPKKCSNIFERAFELKKIFLN